MNALQSLCSGFGSNLFTTFFFYLTIGSLLFGDKRLTIFEVNYGLDTIDAFDGNSQ